jgi:excinuclease ABC subunit C
MALGRVFRVRGGSLLGGETFPLEGTDFEEEPAVLASFLAQHYAAATEIPREILVPRAPAGADLLTAWLSEKRGAAVDLHVPQRGEKRRMMEQVTENAEEALRHASISRDFDADRTRRLLEDLAERLNLSAPPQRIECYDISNIQGTSAVGSMVVFEEGRPRTSDYRRFRIRDVAGSDDFAMLREVLRRRFARFRRGAQVVDDTSFAALPDLVLIDGGRGQLSSAVAAMAELDLRLPTFGLAKRYEELYAAGDATAIRLPRDSEALFLLQRIRDEAHRFAVTYHRKVRVERGLQSELERIEGVGPVLRRALLKRFGSVGAVRAASVDELMSVPRVSRPLALRIKETL